MHNKNILFTTLFYLVLQKNVHSEYLKGYLLINEEMHNTIYPFVSSYIPGTWGEKYPISSS
jgi:hypothetical protein